MTPKRYYTLMMDPELIDALKVAKGLSPELSEAAIIRQALRDWFAKHGLAVKKARAQKRTPLSKSR